MDARSRRLLTLLAFGPLALLGAGTFPWLLWFGLGAWALAILDLLWFAVQVILHPSQARRPTPIQRATGRR